MGKKDTKLILQINRKKKKRAREKYTKLITKWSAQSLVCKVLGLQKSILQINRKKSDYLVLM